MQRNGPTAVALRVEPIGMENPGPVPVACGPARLNRTACYSGQRELAPSARATTSSLAMPWFGPSSAAVRSISGQLERFQPDWT